MAAIAFVGLGLLFLALGSGPLTGLLVWLLALVFVAASGASIAGSLWHSLTQSYRVGGCEVEVKSGLLSKTVVGIPARNISGVVANNPLPLRFFRIGSVTIFTSDGSRRTLFNLRDPDSVAASILAMSGQRVDSH